MPAVPVSAPSPARSPSVTQPAPAAPSQGSQQQQQQTSGVRNYTSIPANMPLVTAAAQATPQPRRPSPYSAHNPAGVERAPSFTALPIAGAVDSLDLCPSNELFNDEIHRILGSAITADANDTFDSVSRLAAAGMQTSK